MFFLGSFPGECAVGRGRDANALNRERSAGNRVKVEVQRFDYALDK